MVNHAILSDMCIYLNNPICLYLYLCICVCVYVYTYVYIYSIVQKLSTPLFFLLSFISNKRQNSVTISYLIQDYFKQKGNVI